MLNVRNKISVYAGKGMGAFTLIELLVVISIIAVLMAVMMPALGKAREQAKMVVCKSNLKQIGTAFKSYSVDCKKYPLGHGWNFPYEFPKNSYDSYLKINNSQDYSLVIGLQRYLADDDLRMFSCPANLKLEKIRESLKRGVWGNMGVNTGTLVGYFYFGNYPMETKVYGEKWKYNMVPDELREYNKGLYPKDSIQSKRVKLMQDMAFDAGYDTLYGTSHEKPNSLYTDGSVEAEVFTDLTGHRRAGQKGDSRPMW